VDKDADEVQSTQRSLDEARTAQGAPDAQARLSDGSLQQKVKGATAKLNVIVAAEMAVRVAVSDATSWPDRAP
jgi:hypothetical protein